MLDLKLLTTFREVAVRGSFSEAAVALDFTQPAVSQHISRLESALGTRVLERSARGVTLTPAGEVLVRHASALLDAARRAEEAVRDAAGIGRAQVRVGAFASAAAGLLPGATRELRARRPDAELTLVVLEDEQAVDALLAGRSDVAVIVQSPEVRRCTRLPVTVHAPFAEKDTGSFESAVALTVKSGSPSARSSSERNVIT